MVIPSYSHREPVGLRMICVSAQVVQRSEQPILAYWIEVCPLNTFVDSLPLPQAMPKYFLWQLKNRFLGCRRVCVAVRDTSDMSSGHGNTCLFHNYTHGIDSVSIVSKGQPKWS